MPTFFKPDTSSYPGIRWPATAVFDAVGVELTPADIRSLNSSPIDIVAGEADVFLTPGQCVFVGAQGVGAYSAAPGFTVQYSDTTGAELEGGVWDGSVGLVEFLPDAAIKISLSASEVTDKLGQALQITSGGDVTDGDAPCTIILFFTRYKLAGRL